MSPSRLSRLESALRVVLAFNEAFNDHDVPAMMQFIGDDCLFEPSGPAPDGTEYRGKAAIAGFWEGFFRRSSRVHVEIEEVFGLGRRCIMRWRYHWEDEAGKPARVRGVDIFRVQDGSIREMRSYVKA